jgi:hypothetical protein
VELSYLNNFLVTLQESFCLIGKRYEHVPLPDLSRTVCLHSAGSQGAADKTLASASPELDKRMEGWGKLWMSRNLLGKGPTLEEVGNMAAFMASDKAGATTGTTINLNEGMVN